MNIDPSSFIFGYFVGAIAAILLFYLAHLKKKPIDITLKFHQKKIERPLKEWRQAVHKKNIDKCE
jgi:hypothetical protein